MKKCKFSIKSGGQLSLGTPVLYVFKITLVFQSKDTAHSFYLTQHILFIGQQRTRRIWGLGVPRGRLMGGG